MLLPLVQLGSCPPCRASPPTTLERVIEDTLGAASGAPPPAQVAKIAVAAAEAAADAAAVAAARPALGQVERV